MSNPSRPTSHLRHGSPLFERLVPVALVILGIVTAVLILFAIGVLAGLIRF